MVCSRANFSSLWNMSPMGMKTLLYHHMPSPRSPGQKAHPEIEQPRGLGLHAITGTFLNGEAIAREHGEEDVWIVAAAMSHQIVERYPSVGMERSRDDEARAWCRDAGDFRKYRVVVLHMLHDIQRANQPEGGVIVGQRIGCAPGAGSATGLPKLANRLATQVEEIRVLQWQAGRSPGPISSRLPASRAIPENAFQVWNDSGRISRAPDQSRS